MAQFKDFAENGKLLEVREEVVSEKNLARYIAEFGVVKAEGYLEGMEAATKELLKALYKDGGKHLLAKPPKQGFNDANELFDRNRDFIEFAKDVIDKEKTKNLLPG